MYITVKKSKKLCLAAGIVLSFAFLAVCKYANFFMSIIYSFLDTAAIPYTVSNINIALPVGISFFSFKAVSYIMWMLTVERLLKKLF